MALNIFGGGGNIWTPGLHTEEADTIAHWPWQGSRADTVGTFNIDTGEFGFGSAGPSDKLAFCPNANSHDNTASTALNPNENTDFKYTFATGLYLPTIASGLPVGNADIVRYEDGAGGNTGFRVGIVAADSRVFCGRDTSAGYQQDVAVATLPRGEWFHFAWTQAADGLSGTFYVNGQLLETWSTANAPNNTAASSRFFLGESWNTTLFGSYYSTIVREKECSAAEVLAMAVQCGF